MGRAFAVAAAFALVGLVGWLVGSSREPSAPARAPAVRTDPLAEFRLGAMERRLREIEARLREGTPGDAGGPPARPADGGAVAGPKRPPAQDADGGQALVAVEREWLDRYDKQQTSADRVEVLRAAGAFGSPDGTAAARRRFFERVMGTAAVGSDEWANASFGLGYLARVDRDFAASDAHFVRVQDAVPRDSANDAMAEFQLGWNRKFAGDARGSEDHFRRFLGHPGAQWGTKAAARYAIANTRLEGGDLPGARAELEALIADADARKGGGETEVAYWRDLAKKALTAAGG